MNQQHPLTSSLGILCALIACVACQPQPSSDLSPERGQDASGEPEQDIASPQDPPPDEEDVEGADNDGGPSAPDDVGAPDASPDAVDDVGDEQDADQEVTCEIPTVTPLYDQDTEREAEILFETEEALITHIADRARDRHAREAMFQSYDHYLPFYWEQRVANLEIVDRVAMGGEGVDFNFVTLDRLNPAEFRTFFANAAAVYHSNQSDSFNAGVTYLGASPSTDHPGETEHTYTATLLNKLPENRPLRVGDRIEIELSQFLRSPRNGRPNYYGTVLLYVVGEGVVPWYAKEREEAATPQEAQRASFDSHPLPARAWSGGRTTIHYPYSDEPEHRFKQTAGNLSHASGFAFMNGRRLHHTDFGTGQHTEPGNPVFDGQIGKAGPRFVARDCVNCHQNNGRDVPPEAGALMPRAVVKLASDDQGSPHPSWGDSLQPQGELEVTGPSLLRREAEDYSGQQGTMTESTTDQGGGLNIGFLDPGDLMSYEDVGLSVDEAGPFVFSFRVASAVGGGRLRLTGPGNAPTYGTLDIPNTGGWQSWTTLHLPTLLQPGARTFEIHVEIGNWNLNWFEIRAAQGDGAQEPVVRLSGYTEIEGQYDDGERYTLRQPVYDFGGDASARHSVRLAPQLVGLGLLEAIDPQDILALADPCDEDDDGISGRPRTVNASTLPGLQLGRFGYKAVQPSVVYQIAVALNRDMGVTSALFPVLDGEDPEQARDRQPEISLEELELMRRYVSLLGVPARRGLSDPQVAQGEALFAEASCDACHTPSFRTGAHHPYAELREQDIQPFTDLLLHDMGPGLSDAMTQPGATAREWRTAPLWGLGLTEGVSGARVFLHDGRARTLAEAILWHGGEATASTEAFKAMSQQERQALLAFLNAI